MKLGSICILSASLLLAFTSSGRTDDQSSIVGVWKPTSFIRTEVQTGKTAKVYGDHPNGYRVHTQGGHAFYFFLAQDRIAPLGAPTDSDRIALFNSMTVAAGTYKVDADRFVFTAEASGNQNLTGKTLTYHFVLSGGSLKMTTEPSKSADGQDIFFTTAYERVE
jgi:hypothetical protein